MDHPTSTWLRTAKPFTPTNLHKHIHTHTHAHLHTNTLYMYILSCLCWSPLYIILPVTHISCFLRTFMIRWFIPADDGLYLRPKFAYMKVKTMAYYWPQKKQTGQMGVHFKSSMTTCPKSMPFLTAKRLWSGFVFFTPTLGHVPKPRKDCIHTNKTALLKYPGR